MQSFKLITEERGQIATLRLYDCSGRVIGLTSSEYGVIWQGENPKGQSPDSTIIHKVRKALQGYRGDRSAAATLYLDQRTAVSLFALRFIDQTSLKSMEQTQDRIIISSLRAEGLSFDILVVNRVEQVIDVQKD